MFPHFTGKPRFLQWHLVLHIVIILWFFLLMLKIKYFITAICYIVKIYMSVIKFYQKWFTIMPLMVPINSYWSVDSCDFWARNPKLFPITVEILGLGFDCNHVDILWIFHGYANNQDFYSKCKRCDQVETLLRY